MRFSYILAPALAGLALAQETPTLLQALNSTADLSTLNQLITSDSLLAQTLAGLSNVTVLAPNNAALAAFTAENNQSLTNPEFLASTLVYHVLNGTYAEFANGSSFIPTALAPGNFANVTGGQVVEASVVNGNTTFFSGFKLNSTTIGSPVTIQGGVVHIIDRVLTLPESIPATGTSLGLSSAVGAIVNASLAEVLTSTGDLTIFVPNNEAFQSIGSALPGLSMEQLSTILQYHVVNQVVYSTDLSNTTVPSLQGTNLNITVYNTSTVYVNNARVIIPDVLVANGVVHVIDKVLNPLNATAPPDEPAYPGATSASTPPFTGQAPTSSRSIAISNIPGATSTTQPGAAWIVRPTGLGAVLLAGAVLVL